MMTNTTIKQATSNKEIVSKPVKQGIKLDLDHILDQVWNQGMPNGIFNGI